MLEEFIIIFILNYTGIIISKIFSLPIPGTIIGMVVFFVLLYFKILKPEKVENAVSVLLLNMTILFLPPAVKVMDDIQLLHGQFFKVLVLIVVTTFITMGVTGEIVQFMIGMSERRMGKKKKGQEK